MARFVFFAFLITPSLISNSASAALSARLLKTCGALLKPVPWTYCIYETEGSRNRDVLYYLHGGNGNEHSWDDYEDVRAAWRADGFEAPVVVTVSLGPIWFLTPKSASPESGQLELFTHSIMPKIENDIIKNFSGRRLAIGHSMGGLNVAQLLMLRPGLISRGVMLNPALSTVTPWDSHSELLKFTRGNRELAQQMTGLVQVGARFVADRAAWEHVTPLGSCSRATLGGIAPVMVFAGQQDDWFYLPTRKFVRVARAQGARIRWWTRPGGHQQFSAVAAARFLSGH